VLAFTRLQAGSADNVVPGDAQARGTVRALDPDDREPLLEELRRITEHVGAGYGCEAQLRVIPNEPTLVNDPALAQAAMRRLAECGLQSTGEFRSCGSDDFSFYAELAPTLMVFVGLQDAPGFRSRSLHHDEFAPPDDAVEHVARAYLAGYLAAADPA
jgi:metal-dependent amidase/aminoacylase/carboxypeptidase family protein